MADESWPDADTWWADAPTTADVDVWELPVPDDVDTSDLIDANDMVVEPLTVPEILVAAALAGPGAECVRLLALLPALSLSRNEWLSAVQLWEVQDAWAAGQRGVAVLGFAGSDPVTVDGVRDDEELILELAMALGCSEGFAYAQITSARVLSSTLLRTGDLLRAGQLSPYRARLIVDELAHLHPDIARQVEAQVLDSAATAGIGRLRRVLTDKARRAERRADREAANDRKVARLADDTARRGRRVEFVPEAEDGLMGMFAFLPPVEAMAMQRTLEALAGPYRKADGRMQPQRQADALMGTVLGFDPDQPGQPVKPKVTVGLLIDIATVLCLRDRDGELLGYGHLPADVARELATNASWQRLVYDPVNGYLLDRGVEVHDFAALTEFIRLRDRYDRFPGGHRPAEDGDLDHTRPFRGSPKATTSRTDTATSAEPAAAAPSALDEGGLDEGGLDEGGLDEVGVGEPSADEAAPDEVSGNDARGQSDEIPPSVEDPQARAPGDGDTVAATRAGRTAPVSAVAGATAGAPTQEGRHSAAAEAGGHTSANNLAALSRRHHRAKTFLNFTYRHLGLGVLEWTTPLGRTYRTCPHDYRPDDDDDRPP